MAFTEINRSLAPGPPGYSEALAGAVPAIQSFGLTYTDRDHFVREIGAGAITSGGRDFALLFGGKSHAEPRRLEARFLDFRPPGGARPLLESVSSSSARGIGHRIPMRRFRDREVFLLAGFSFDFGPGNDHQIERMQLLPRPEHGFIAVGFGAPTGTVAFSATIVYLAAHRALFAPRLWADPVGQVAHLPRFRFDIFLHREPGIALLTGFDLRFDGVQNVLSIAIDLRTDLHVTYTGNAPGQPAVGSVEYVILRKPWFSSR